MTSVLCIPEKYVPIILYQYHQDILGGHPGVRKLTESISRKYYFPGLHTIVRQYGYKLFRLSKHEKKGERCFNTLS